MIYFISAVILILFIFLATTYACYRIAFGYYKKLDIPPLTLPKGELYENLHPMMTEMINEAINILYEEVSVKSFDGLTLYGRYYHLANDKPVQILFHGYRSNAIRDFSGGINFYMNLGFNVLLVDQRAHGKSKAKTTAFGVLERYDVLSWVNYVISRCGVDVPITITGISMGAATVLMASDLDLPKNVKGIIADCGYSSPKEIICKTIKDLRYPVKLIYPFVRIGGIIYGGFDVQKSSAETSIKNTNIPVLLVHGEQDEIVPVEMSDKLYNVCHSKCTFLKVKGAVHGVSYLVDRETYTLKVKEFFQSINIK